MRIVITGGSGFIGTDLSRVLIENHEVSAFDFNRPVLERVQFLKGDINNFNNVNQSIKNCDIVIHLAAALGVVNTETNPINTMDTNTFGTRNVLEACRLNDVKKIIFSSSSEVYGEPLKVPIEETDRSIPITPYGVSKLAAEEYIKSYSKTYGLRYTLFRLFNVYGENQGNQWVMPEFVSKAIKDENIIIHGDGSQIRAFCHVSDVSRAFSSVIEKGDGELFNIGNNKEPISIKELAYEIISIANSKSSVSFLPFEKSNRKRTEILKRIPNIDKARKMLGYEPQVPLKDGISRMIIKKRELMKSLDN